MSDQNGYVEWFRNSAPYINAHRGRVFVIQFGGEALAASDFPALIHDIALLSSLGVKLVLVPGARPQIEERLAARGLTMRYEQGLRVTDTTALTVVKEATGANLLDIEALLSMGVANSPMAGAHLRVVSGNYVTARPIGVRDGVDFAHTGQVRRIDGESIERHLGMDNVVLVSPLGFSPTGEVFNLSAEEVATAVAVELRAAKLLLLAEDGGGAEAFSTLPREMTLEQARALLAERHGSHRGDLDPLGHLLECAAHACRNGVKRVHLLRRALDGALLQELFTRDGVATMVNADPYDITRKATIEDVGGILELIEPLERHGALVRRSREKLEMEIGRFLVMERDGTIIACAAVYPFDNGRAVELACVAVHPDYRKAGRGDQLFDDAEREARAAGAECVFVLSTQATQWFQERGFAPATVEDLPTDRREFYNYTRRSKVLVKRL